MLDALVKVLLYVLFPVCAMIIGGMIASFRAPGPRLGSAVQHFAAGMVFAAVAIELLPDVVSKRAPLATVLGFSLGVALMLLVSCQRPLVFSSSAFSLLCHTHSLLVQGTTISATLNARSDAELWSHTASCSLLCITRSE